MIKDSNPRPSITSKQLQVVKEVEKNSKRNSKSSNNDN